MKKSGFTLIEMLLATTISAVLMGAVLMILANLSRDRWRLDRAQSAKSMQPLLEQLRWDLTNATTMSQSPGGQRLTLIGHGGIDPDTLTPTGRLSRVVYRAEHGALVREQFYLDDPVRPQQWRELVAAGFKDFAIIPRGVVMPIVEDPEAPDRRPGEGAIIRVPQRLQLRVDLADAHLNEELWIK